MPRLKKQFGKISDPLKVKHLLHIDNDLKWTFDVSVEPKTIFTILETIGKGGFGTVFKILHRPSMKILAGKIIIDSLINSESKQDLEYEIKLMKEINSTHAIKYYGCVDYEGSLMILMEYCDKGSLRDILDSRKKVFSEDQIAFIMYNLLLGLKLIHNKYHIIHRDIKAANILVTSSGSIKIADFGVSRRFETSEEHTITIVGSLYWMAPEVIQAKEYSFPADIWSVGITAVELAEGSPPFVEYEPARAMLNIVMHGFPGYRFPKLHSNEFMDFVSKCVIIDQNKRWTIDQLLEHSFIQRGKRLDYHKVMNEIISFHKTNNVKNFSLSTEIKVKNDNKKIYIQQTGEVKFDITFLENKIQNKLMDDETFFKISKIKSERIPFTPFIRGTNVEVPFRTVYHIPKSQFLLPLFDKDGVISINTALRHKKAPKFISFTLVLLTFLIFGSGGFLILISICLICRMILIYIEKH